jgi:hypothetical protein
VFVARDRVRDGELPRFGNSRKLELRLQSVSTIRPQSYQHLVEGPISTRTDDFHVSGIPETRKRRLSQTWVCCNLHKSRGNHAANLDGVFEAVAVALSVRIIAHKSARRRAPSTVLTRCTLLPTACASSLGLNSL